MLDLRMAKRPLRTQQPRNPSNFGERVRYARHHNEMSLEDLVKALSDCSGTKYSKSLVSKWELGGVKNPQNNKLLHLAEVTGFNLEWLIRGEGPPRRTTRSSACPPPLDIALLASSLEKMMKSLGKESNAGQIAIATANAYEMAIQYAHSQKSRSR